MAASDDFKQKLKAGKIVEALSTALSEAIELEITTWVAKADSDREQPEPGSRMQTRINIVDGDITNEIGNQFLDTGPYSELRQFHLEQVQQSREIIQDNLKSLQKLFGIWAQMRPSNSPKLSGVESPKLPPDDADPLVMEPEVSVVEVAIASESVIEVDTVSEAPSDPSPTPPQIGEGLLDSASQNKSSSFPSPLAGAESLGFPTSPLAASVPAQTPPVAPTPSPQTSETTVEPVLSSEEWEQEEWEEVAPTPSPQTSETIVEPVLSAEEWEQEEWEEVAPAPSPQTSEIIVEPVLSAEEWEQALLEEPPSEPAWTATQETVVNWGSDEEWEDVEVEEPEQRFTGWSQTGLQDDEWEGFDNWEEEEQSQPNQPQRNFTSSDRLSNPMAVLFGDIPPEEKPQSNSEMPDEETPVTFEDPFFSDIPVEPGDNNPTDEKSKKPK
ncbi:MULTISPECIES: hypothetical protein [Cyanophyceae]|uniref:hypothetical protein n=1 Tax=Cyanophyceae TaxID=3028117 RepID=UPI00168826ED|nr:hypothetical protein [Trichocoleus sp. FACHB-69]MBD1933381.1 hypothetical protein [Trichocoleus sp. FACHB-69]